MRFPAQLRLLPAAALCWLAAGVVIGIPDAAPASAVIGAVVAGGLALTAVRVRVLVLPALAVAAAALVLGSIALSAPARVPADLVAAAESGRSFDLEVTVGGRTTEGRFAGVLANTRVPVLVFAEPGTAPPIGATVTLFTGRWRARTESGAGIRGRTVMSSTVTAGTERFLTGRWPWLRARAPSGRVHHLRDNANGCAVNDQCQGPGSSRPGSASADREEAPSAGGDHEDGDNEERATGEKREPAPGAARSHPDDLRARGHRAAAYRVRGSSAKTERSTRTLTTIT